MFLMHVARGIPGQYFAYIRNYAMQGRGMSWLRDKIDWIGGYPFEVSTPDQVFDFFIRRGYELRRLKSLGSGHGCNEFVFVKKV